MSVTIANMILPASRCREWKDAAGVPLREGAFYWALPVHDPDTDLEWQNEEQPARFAGYSETGGDRWFWLGVSGDGVDGVSTWPARWVGHEIRRVP
jgi:hypothetical protein